MFSFEIDFIIDEDFEPWIFMKEFHPVKSIDIKECGISDSFESGVDFLFVLNA